MAAGAVVELVLADFAAQRVAVNAESFGGTGLIAIEAFQDALDELLFELGDGFFEQDAALDHHANQRFQLIFHDCTLRSDAWAKEPLTLTDS